MEKPSFESLAICPLDGRYSGIMNQLEEYFSEYALVRNRVLVEIEWLKFLINNIDNDILKQFNKEEMESLTSLYQNFDANAFNRIKEIEATTKHDVKAVELFVAEELEKKGYDYLKSFVHIGCTSEDINNTAYANMIKSGLNNIWLPAADKLNEQVTALALQYKDVPMLGHTHGQPATPTTVGKEFKVYAYRFSESLKHISEIKIKAKFNGATGNYSAISIAFPNYDWEALSQKFIEEYLGLEYNPLTTQIESHDYICHILDGVRHFNNVMLDLDLDMWIYISMNYFKQITVKGEVGSSTMPHKVNPINFENSESNIDMSNAICVSLSNKLPKSRMQRDLSDSSSLRNLGLPFGYSLQSINETIRGLKKSEVNEAKIEADLNERWEVLAEPIQTMLRKYGIPDAYNKLKELTRGKEITKEDILTFIESLDCLTDEDKKTLMEMTPASYVGLARIIVK